MIRKFLGATLFFSLAATLLALANDTEAETALGGLTLKRSEFITMDSEDLYLSPERVRVTYRFTNTSDAPVETLVAFPLPDIPPDETENKAFWSDPAQLKFRTTVDGKPVAYEIVQQALFRGADLSARLAALGLPLNPRAANFFDSLHKLGKAERRKLEKEGLLDAAAGDDAAAAKWTTRTTVTRKQTFPAKATVVVEHEYVPLTGGSVAGGLSLDQRKTDWFREKQRRYCIDKDWIDSFDRRIRKNPDGDAYGEVWLGYVLTTGANWKGPIHDFRLVVDKGKPETLVSFCAEGVKKISPTQFEARATDFVPRKELEILFVNFSN